jgi:Lon protease-like protein
MFPLGTVLFPGGLLPLHIFEPRYRRMLEVCLDGDSEFGVVLIERGSEVGGGDTRFDMGTVAKILRASEFSDGRWGVLAAGTRRIRVVRWLPEEPYPRAEVVDVDESDDERPPTDDLEAAHALLRRVLALGAELGLDTAPATIELDGDPVVGCYQACWVAPLNTFDKQRLLEAGSPVERLAMLTSMLDEEGRVLEHRLALGER